jgi:putative ubiquitin-RnfH superfamily antitoxin RatB of RatAB toxin-antitoxin module
MQKNTLSIEITYVDTATTSCIPLEVEPGTTIEEAIVKSGLLEKYPHICLHAQNGQSNLVGIFGELKSLNGIVKAGDQIEVYRPLKADPMLLRNALVKKERKLRRQRREKHPW